VSHVCPAFFTFVFQSGHARIELLPEMPATGIDDAEAINYKYFDPPTLEFLIPERGPAGYDLFFTATHSLQSSLFSCSHHHLFLT